MKRGFIACLSSFCLLSWAATVSAGDFWNVTFGAIPAGFTNAASLDGFKASSPLGGDVISGNLVYSPTFFMGFDFDPGGGFGWELFDTQLYHSDGLKGNLFGVNASFIAPHRHAPVRARMKGGVFSATMNWEGDDTDVEFEDTAGWQAGMGLDFGRRVSFTVEFLYRWLRFDVDKPHSDQVNKETLDLSGPVFNFGIKFSF